jgi:arginine decarboxylase-like protein|tara:strand:+ start:3648 stop:3845 length:198 start_codon:yes stop_codon:yes gene_type:complete
MNQIEALDVLTMHALFGDETRARLIAAIAVIEPIASRREHNGTGDSIEEMLEMVQKALDTMPETD